MRFYWRSQTISLIPVEAFHPFGSSRRFQTLFAIFAASAPVPWLLPRSQRTVGVISLFPKSVVSPLSFQLFLLKIYRIRSFVFRLRELCLHNALLPPVPVLYLPPSLSPFSARQCKMILCCIYFPEFLILRAPILRILLFPNFPLKWRRQFVFRGRAVCLIRPSLKSRISRR